MYPGPIHLAGIHWAAWDLAFLVGIAVGYLVLRATGFARERANPSSLLGRYALVVYICALGAQWFAYAVDADTTVLPPEGFPAWRYYLHPLAGPKTLFGAVLALPLAARIAFVSRSVPSWSETVDRLTPALFTILGFARVGCFLQGCCYGLRSELFGLRFAPGSLAHAEQFHAGLIGVSERSFSVLPTQLASSAACFLIAVWAASLLRRGKTAVFVKTLAVYSVFRFAIEFLRADLGRNQFWIFSTSQWVALVVLLSIWSLHRRAHGTGSATA